MYMLYRMYVKRGSNYESVTNGKDDFGEWDDMAKQQPQNPVEWPSSSDWWNMVMYQWWWNKKTWRIRKKPMNISISMKINDLEMVDGSPDLSHQVVIA